jgi:pyruvate,water dikinase
MEYVIFFKNLSKNSVKEAGGKGASLAEMYNSKIPVPNGFVITSYSYKQFLKQTYLNIEIDSILNKVNVNNYETIEKASREIEYLILNQEFPNNLKQKILSSFKRLDSKYVAVRSSATSEDSSKVSWAGQLNTYINTTKKTLLENVKKCFASLFTQRAIFYRFEKKLNKKDVSVAVVVQKMIESDVSGIAFSIHPVTNDYNQMIIEAGYGLGEAIVSGSITPDNYVVLKDSLEILDKNIASQEKYLKRCSIYGIKWRLVLKTKQNKQKLTDSQIKKLSKLILKIEKHYGFAVDVEWAIKNDKIYITQSRPITTLKSKKPIKKSSEEKDRK